MIFNADEIFKMGVQIEVNGREFYLKAAAKSGEKHVKDLLTSLADWESNHIKLFEQLREKLPESRRLEELFDPDNEAAAYLKASADNHIFVKNKDLDTLIDKCNNARDLIAIAISFEKDSVVYYTSMKQVVPEDLGRKNIDALINEEITHIAQLTRELQKLK